MVVRSVPQVPIRPVGAVLVGAVGDVEEVAVDAEEEALAFAPPLRQLLAGERAHLLSEVLSLSLYIYIYIYIYIV